MIPTNRRRWRLLAAAGLASLATGATWASGPPNMAELQAQQRQAQQALAGFDGHWRGPAKALLPDGRWLELTQTERVGTLLGGTIRLVEGRGWAADGSSPFNAFAVISYTPYNQRYHFRSYAQGHQNDFPLELRPDGFAWTAPAGPNARIRYTATLKDGVWTEIGERLVEGQPPLRTFEMRLQRLGDTAWPLDGTVAPK